MANIIHLETHSSEKGNLTVIEDQLPFDIKRVFYIYGVDDSIRGGHRHKTTIQAAICINGKCEVSYTDGIYQESFILDNPKKCLILYPKDWHIMKNFTSDAILLVLASTAFDPDDYIYEKYKRSLWNEYK
jgi:hypothetical protein